MAASHRQNTRSLGNEETLANIDALMLTWKLVPTQRELSLTMTVMSS
jgi:hypothetical protein